MGCTSSAPTTGSVSQAAAGAAQKAMGPAPKKGAINACIEMWYFDGLCGRADPIAQMFAYHGQDWKKRGWSQEEWGAAKAKNNGMCGEFNGGLPQVKFTVGGKKMDCSGLSAIMHMFGVKYGYYDPKNFKQASLVDPIIESFGDVIGCVGGVAFAPEGEAKNAAIQKFTDVTKRFLMLVDKALSSHSGKWVAGNSITIADFVMASFYGNLVMNPNCPLKGVTAPMIMAMPKLKSHSQNVAKEMTYLTTRGAIGPF